jgi:tRNA C32,U32 (ribose-2'-O)-methylase TrmJ
MSSEPSMIEPAQLARVTAVLVAPRHGAEVGASARAMKNMGLGALALCAPAPEPDQACFDEDARRLAVDAVDVLERMRVGSDLSALVAPSAYVVLASAQRLPGLERMSARAAATAVRDAASGCDVAIVFADDQQPIDPALVERADAGVVLPEVGGLAALATSQALMLVAYEIRVACLSPRAARDAPMLPPPAERDAADADIADALATLGPEAGEALRETLLGLLSRSRPSARELRMLRGICRQVRWRARQPEIPGGG